MVGQVTKTHGIYNYKKFRFYGKAGPQNQGEPVLYAQKLTSKRSRLVNILTNINTAGIRMCRLRGFGCVRFPCDRSFFVFCRSL